MRPDALGTLEDIQEAIRFILEDTAGASYETFAGDRRMRQLVGYNFLIIGEPVGRLYRHHPDILGRISDHREIIDFRNALIHGYDTISYLKVWQICREYMPKLRLEVDALLETR